MIPLLHNPVVQSVVTSFLFAWLGSMNPASRNCLKSVAGEITGVKPAQLADNCNKRAVRGGCSRTHTSATCLRKVKATFLEAQTGGSTDERTGGEVRRATPRRGGYRWSCMIRADKTDLASMCNSVMVRRLTINKRMEGWCSHPHTLKYDPFYSTCPILALEGHCPARLPAPTPLIPDFWFSHLPSNRTGAFLPSAAFLLLLLFVLCIRASLYTSSWL